MNEDYADHGKQPVSTALELRDYFAAKAMTSLISELLDEVPVYSQSEVAELAYMQADEMLKARLK